MPKSYDIPRKTRNYRKPPIQPGEPLVSVWPDMAKRLGISKWKAWELIRTEQIPSLTIGDRRLIPSSWVDAYLEERASVA